MNYYANWLLIWNRLMVYVDDMRAPYGRMIFCHMLADSDEELHAMADKIGVARRWHQEAGTYRSHYDISLTKRALAVQHGAVEITMRQTGEMMRHRRLMHVEMLNGAGVGT